MTSSVLELPALQAVAPGQTASLNIPRGVTYRAIFLKIQHGAVLANMSQADMKTHIERIKLRIAKVGKGSDTFWDVTGTQLKMLNDYYVLPGPNGTLGLYFVRPYFNSPGVEDAFALGTLDVQNVILEIKLSSTVVNPTIVATAVIKDGANEPLGDFIRLNTFSYAAAAAAGVREIADLPLTGPGMFLKALHVDTANITKLELRINHSDFREYDPDINAVLSDFDTYRTGGRAAQAGFTHMDLTGNRGADIMPTAGVTDFRLKLTMSAADAFQVLTETIERAA